MDKTTKIFLGFIAAALVVLALVSLGGKQSNLGSVLSNGQAFGNKTVSTSTIVSVSTATTSLLNINTGRDFGSICIAASSSASAILSIGLNRSAVASSTSGLQLSSSTSPCIQFDQLNPFFGEAVGVCSQSCWANVLDY